MTQHSTSAGQPVALVTGSAKRIGKTLITRLHAQGYAVIVHYHHSADAADTLVTSLNDTRSGSATALQADLSDPQAVKRLGQDALRCFGRLDVLINNASAFYPTPLNEASPDDWHSLMGSNVQGAYFLTQAVAGALNKTEGVIINMVDMHIDRPLPEHSLYCMAKSALASLTRSLATELAPDVRVNGIGPGAILWPERDMDEDDRQAMLAGIPLNRLGSPDDIADTALFLIKARYITGQIIYVDGGRSIHAVASA
ncbi:pteridine reductase [Alteromonas halophila]|uniref:Pteridine reductase n=1 Tax=Alteromonas halophila TaxID=516698 RepID=A0A918JGG2_9ALTE|nr:pteridine reductase [Alteromonas halophila]GGW76301.1 pteridine reductase [Alteromonas halophila]